jgi:nucleotide-binding universal stress UspA family protein
MYGRILIPLDGSPVAEQVLPLAKMFVKRLRSSVVLLQAVEPLGKRMHVEGATLHVDEQVEAWRKQALDYLQTIQRDFPAGISVECATEVGSPATVILDWAESARVDLIAMATHGRTGPQRWVYGSVAAKALTGTRLPVLLVRAVPTPRPLSSIRRILVPLDGSELAEQALVPAQIVGAVFDAEIILFRVVDFPGYAAKSQGAGMYTSAVEDAMRETAEEYLAQTAGYLQAQGARVKWETRLGLATERILEAAQEQVADLIIMSTHGRSGLGRWVMGSESERVLSASQIPVLLVRSKEQANRGD